jgi:UDP-N-acetylglucosamine 2-epimerase (non-hydrolysing)
VGNVMIDSLLAARERASSSSVLGTLGLSPGGYGLVTLHRPSNVDNPEILRERLSALEPVAAELPLVFPVHPRTRGRLLSAGLEPKPPGWRLTEPFGYVDFVRLLSSARVVLTDSGGIQEETTVLGVPCVTLRESTERPVTVTEGSNYLAGTSTDGIREACLQALAGGKQGRVPKLWDGQAGARIAQVLAEVLAP